MMTFTNSYDAKIMNFDVATGYEAFMEQFTENEIDAMDMALTDYDFDIGIDEEYDYNQYRASVVSAYVREWLIQNVKNGTVSGSHKLFDIVFNLF